jgi:transcriptional regulator with XRE-family HTH domain
MTVSKRIKTLRKRAGLSPAAVASAIGLNLPSYYDLESYEDEWESAVNLSHFRVLAKILNVSPLELAGVSEDGLCAGTAEGFQTLIKEWLSQGNRREDLSWEIDGILCDAEELYRNPVIFLKDLGTDLGFDWRAFL